MNASRVVAIALFAFALALPAAAQAGGGKGAFAVARLQPFSGSGDEGLVFLDIRPQRTRIIGSFSWGEHIPKTIMLSRRSCARVQSKPNRPGFIGRSIYTANPGQGITFEGKTSRSVARRQLRATKSIVLVSDGEPRSCGAAGFTEFELPTF